MKFAPIMNPAARRKSPKPVRVDLRKVFLVGIGAWIMAAVVFAVLKVTGMHVTRYLYVCFAGIIIGFVLLVWEYFDRPNYRKLGA